MLDFTINIAQKAAEIILSEKKHLSVEKKSTREIVTNADIAAEKYISDTILRTYPNHHILGEESYVKGKNYQDFQDLWIVDPIDGTTNFSQGLSEYGISIAYYRNLEPIVGVVYAPEKHMLFTGETGKGAFLNSQKIQVSEKKELKDVVCGGLFSYEMEQNEAIFDLSKKLYSNIKTMRFIGSAVLDLCFTGAGYLDGTFGYSLKPWDVAAGYIIAKEGGAEISTLKGEKWSLFQPEILVANTYLHPQLVRLFTQFLP